MACVSTVSYSVLLNGASHGFIKPERGLRQGDPLSPFLFILCAEALVNGLNMSAELGKLHGIKLGASGPAVHHLLFADDSLLMCKANALEAEEIMMCLKRYGDASGQLINPLKSSVIFGSKVPADVKTEVQGILDIDKKGGEGTYLGLPECFSGSKRQLLSFIRSKLHGRLNGWFAKALSQGGKEILLKSVCLSLPIYAMSCFHLPKDTCARLVSAMTEFWWSSGSNKRKIAWVSWQKVCKSKNEGGLGFKDLEMFNQSLLGKQAYRIWSSPDSLVARVLKHRYFKNCSFMESNLGSRPSFAWRSILHGREVLKQGLVQSIGDGSSTNVWWDKWIIDKIPRCPNYRENSVVDLTLKVEDLFDHHTGTWNENLLRQTFSPTDVEIILKTWKSPNRPDKLIWAYTKDGKYTSKSGYKFLEIAAASLNFTEPAVSALEKKLWSELWKTKTSPKLRHFLWKILSCALAVRARLRTRGPEVLTLILRVQRVVGVTKTLRMCCFIASLRKRSGLTRLSLCLRQVLGRTQFSLIYTISWVVVKGKICLQIPLRCSLGSSGIYGKQGMSFALSIQDLLRLRYLTKLRWKLRFGEKRWLQVLSWKPL